MEIKIEGTVTINTEDTADNGVALIGNETTFNELMHILATRPEVLTAAENEAADRADEAEEARIRKAYGEVYEMVKEPLQKEKRRPGAIQLRENFPCIGRTDLGRGGACEVYSNGYAIYDNGDRRTVLWVPDCSTTTYYFGKLRDNEKEYLKETDEIGEDVMGACAWYIALMIAGENSIEHNMDHPKSIGTTSDSDREEYEVEKAQRWIGGTHYDTPEEAYLKKEAAEERRNALTEKQREVYVMYYEEGKTVYEIADILGISEQAVSYRLNGIRKKLKKFFDDTCFLGIEKSYK